MKCRSCDATENLMRSGHRNGKQRYMCRACNAKKKRDERIKKIPALNRATESYRKRFPERHQARLLARKHIPLRLCQVCGEKAVRHHPDWSKPLEVVFLCHLHHKHVHLGLIPCPK